MDLRGWYISQIASSLIFSVEIQFDEFEKFFPSIEVTVCSMASFSSLFLPIYMIIFLFVLDNGDYNQIAIESSSS